MVLADNNDSVESGETRGWVNPTTSAGTHYRIGDRHSGGANVLFTDGHVEWFLKSTIDSSDWIAKNRWTCPWWPQDW